MYKPKDYSRLMLYANALWELADRPIWGLVPARGKRTFAYRVGVVQQFILRRLFARFDDLAEVAYLIGHDEGYKNGLEEGIMQGHDEANCHRQTDEEWEARVNS